MKHISHLTGLLSGGKHGLVSLCLMAGKHILFEKLRQGEMLKGLGQLHAALIVSRLGSFTEPELPGKHSAYTTTNTLMFERLEISEIIPNCKQTQSILKSE